MSKNDRERTRARGAQGGFTLLELLVVIAILGVLGGVATFGVSKFRRMAQNTALDQSLVTVATAVEAQILMDGLADLSQIDPQTLPVRNAEGIEFAAYDLTPTSAVVQARFKNSSEPCRQIRYPDTTPGPCDPTDGKIPKIFTPGYSDTNQMAMMRRGDTGTDPKKNILDDRAEENDPKGNPKKDGGSDGSRMNVDDAGTRRKELEGAVGRLKDDIMKMESERAAYLKKNQATIDDLRRTISDEKAKGEKASQKRLDELTGKLHALEMPIAEYDEKLRGAHAKLDDLDKQMGSLNGHKSDGREGADRRSGGPDNNGRKLGGRDKDPSRRAHS